MRIDHLLVFANDMRAMRRFFLEVIGLEDGPRPPFAFPGHWLYSEGQALIHLAHRGVDANRIAYLGEASSGAGGVIDHVALTGADPSGLVARLTKAGVRHTVNRVPAENQLQLFVPGHEGLRV